MSNIINTVFSEGSTLKDTTAKIDHPMSNTLNDLLLTMFDFNNEAYSVSSDIDQVSLSFQGNNVGTVMLNTEWSLSHKPQQPVITIVGDPTAVSSESITKAMTLVDLVNDFRNATDSTEHQSLTLNLVSSEINTSAEVLHESTQGEFDKVVEWTKERLAAYGATEEYVFGKQKV